MLIELSIKNFAIIEQLSISFDKGLTVLTGETGAGKSIIIDAIGLLCGGRGSTEFVRHGTQRAEIEGLFLIEDEHHPVFRKATDLGIDIGEDHMVVLRRDITSNGKSICRINGKLVTLAILREVGSVLVDIHGQHEHQQIMQAERHLAMLDQFWENKIKAALTEYRTLYQSYRKLLKEIEQYSENEQKLAQRLDLLQYQLEEITNANLKVEEDVLLAEEKYKLANSEKLYKTVHDCYQALYGDGKGLDWLMLALNNIDEAAEIDKNLRQLKDTVSNSYYLLEEATFSLRDYYEAIEFDPDRLNYIQGRLNEIGQLKRKYGESVSDILEFSAKVEEEIDTLNNRDEKISKLKDQIDSIILDLAIEARNVTKLRTAAAEELIHQIHKHLKELYMEKTKFFIEIKRRNGSHKDPIVDGEPVSFQEDGIDKVEFLLSTNPGEPVKPLVKIASGGEISRIMLALKSIFSHNHRVTSLIFDEVDTGVSGRVAQAIAKKIHHISTNSQVLCITHLPQVAAMADTHLYISKDQTNDKTKTGVNVLVKNERIEEVARMLAGIEVTELTRKHAQELIEQALDHK